MGRSALVLSTLLLVILVDLGSNLAFLAAISLLFWGAWGGREGKHKAQLGILVFCHYFELFNLIMVL